MAIPRDKKKDNIAKAGVRLYEALSGLDIETLTILRALIDAVIFTKRITGKK